MTLETIFENMQKIIRSPGTNQEKLERLWDYIEQTKKAGKRVKHG